MVLQVDEAELRLLDGLNKGYARVHLEDHIHGKDNHPTFQRRGMSSTVWIYLPNGNMNPTNQGTAEPGKSAAAPDPNPIVQTYVDQVVIGALRLGGPHFAYHFVDATKGWHHPWVNNRTQSIPGAGEVDAVLERIVGKEFRKRTNLKS